MSPTGRNDPCPCGSGLKHKRCCLGEAGGPASTLPPGTYVVTRGGQRFVASAGASDEALDSMASHLAEKRRGRGPAQQMAEFSQPLIDATGGDPAALQNALSLGMMFWNLAIVKDDKKREDLLEDVVGKLAKTGEGAEQFRTLAATMLARHKAMFPELHG